MSGTTHPVPGPTRARLVGGIVVSVLWTGVGLLSIVPAMMSVMMFDAPGSEDNGFLWLAFLGTMSFPFACFGSAAAAGLALWLWSRKARADEASAVPWGLLHFGLNLLPLVSVSLAVLGFLLIEWVCDGSFSC